MTASHLSSELSMNEEPIIISNQEGQEDKEDRKENSELKIESGQGDCHDSASGFFTRNFADIVKESIGCRRRRVTMFKNFS